MKNTLLILLLVLACTGCNTKNEEFTLTVMTENPNNDGTVLYITDLSMHKLDSLTLQNNVGTLTGTIKKPLVISVNARSVAALMPPVLFVLEPGEITIKNGQPSGTPLNDKLSAFMNSLHEVPFGDMDVLNKSLLDFIDENKNNQLAVIGLYSLVGTSLMPLRGLSTSNTLAPRELLNIIDGLGKELEDDANVENIRRRLTEFMKTEVGSRYIDFETDYYTEVVDSKWRVEASPNRFTNFLENDKYTLVHFQGASICDIESNNKMLIELQEKYKDNKLKVITVWYVNKIDEDPGMSNQTNYTVLYASKKNQNLMSKYSLETLGSFMILSPQGIILERDIQAEELPEVIEQLFAE